MKDILPTFKYHPYPLKTGSAKQNQFKCSCCGMQKEYVYEGPVYSKQKLEKIKICLSCIQDGSAAQKFNAEFTGCIEGSEDISKDDIDELLTRTPGYISWQEQIWLSHCHSICGFYGDFDPIELQEVYSDEENKGYLKENLGCDDQELKEIILNYNPVKSTQPSFYKFQCLICKKVLVHADFT